MTTHTSHCPSPADASVRRYVRKEPCQPRLLVDKNTSLLWWAGGRAATSFPPHVQGDLIFSTTYPETVFENCVISSEFGLEWLGLVLGRVCCTHLPSPQHAHPCRHPYSLWFPELLWPLVEGDALMVGGKSGSLTLMASEKGPLKFMLPQPGVMLSQMWNLT